MTNDDYYVNPFFVHRLKGGTGRHGRADGGPGANPKFIYDANVLLFGTDPVAVDAMAHDMIVKERMARGTQQVDARGRSAAFLDIAEGLGLGVAAREKIKIADMKPG